MSLTECILLGKVPSSVEVELLFNLAYVDMIGLTILSVTSLLISLLLSSRCLLANLKYYQTDVCWQMSNTIKPTALI